VLSDKSSVELDFDARKIHKKMHCTNPKDLLGANRTVRQAQGDKAMMNALDVRVNERVVIGGELAPLQTITSQGGTTFYGSSGFGKKHDTDRSPPTLSPLKLQLNNTMKPKNMGTAPLSPHNITSSQWANSKASRETQQHFLPPKLPQLTNVVIPNTERQADLD